MPQDVVDLILADHREVERLFDKMREDPESRPMLLPTVTTLLIAHSRAEESEVYPVARDEAGETDEVAHVLGMWSPGSALRFITDIGAALPPSGHPDLAVLAEVYRRHHSQLAV